MKQVYNGIAAFDETVLASMKGWAENLARKELAADKLPEPDRSVELRKLQAEITEVSKGHDTYLEAKKLAVSLIDNADPNADPATLTDRITALLKVALNSLDTTINRFK